MKKILVIDPAKTFIKYVELVVKHQGYRIVPAGTASEALAAFEKGDIAMIITADSLPDAGFGDFCHVFREKVNEAGVPVLVLSPEDQDEMASQCQEFTFAEVRTKPIAMPELLEVLQEALPISNTRKKVRAPVQLKALMREVGDLKSYHAFNLSEGGVFLVRENPPPVGAEVEVLLPLPGLATPLKVVGKVVSRVDEPAPGSPPGFGIEFLEMEEEAGRMLADYLESHISEMKP